MLQVFLVFLCFSGQHALLMNVPQPGDDLQAMSIFFSVKPVEFTKEQQDEIKQVQDKAVVATALTADLENDDDDSRSLRQGARPTKKTRMASFLQAVTAGFAAMAPEDYKQFAQSGADGIAFLIAWFESGRPFRQYHQETTQAFLDSLSDETPKDNEGHELKNSKGETLLSPRKEEEARMKAEEARFVNGRRVAVLNIIGLALLIVMAACDKAETVSDVVPVKGLDPMSAMLHALKDVFVIIRFTFSIVLDIIKEAVQSPDPDFNILAAMKKKMTWKFLGYACWMIFKGIAQWVTYMAVAAVIAGACMGFPGCAIIGSVVGSVVSWGLGMVFKGMEYTYNNWEEVKEWVKSGFDAVGNSIQTNAHNFAVMAQEKSAKCKDTMATTAAFVADQIHKAEACAIEPAKQCIHCLIKYEGYLPDQVFGFYVPWKPMLHIAAHMLP